MTDETITNEPNIEYDPIYPVLTDVLGMVKLTDDSLTDDLIESSLKNADGIIEGMLSDVGLPTFKIDDEIPKNLQTAGNYLSASDIHQALDGTDDRSTNEQAYYEKAMDILQRYIDGKLSLLETAELKESRNPYASSKSPSVFELGIRRR